MSKIRTLIEYLPDSIVAIFDEREDEDEVKASATATYNPGDKSPDEAIVQCVASICDQLADGEHVVSMNERKRTSGGMQNRISIKVEEQ